MALTDVLFTAGNNAAASRGNVGTLVDILQKENNTGYVSPIYDGGYWWVSAAFKNSASIDLPDGTLVNAYHSTTHLKVGSGSILGGVATFKVSTSHQVYLVVDPSSSGLGGETVCTTVVTPL